MIRLGLRLALAGGRAVLTRLLTIALAVTFGVGMVLTTLAGLQAVQSQNARYAWLATAADPGAQLPATQPGGLWFNEFTDEFRGTDLLRVDLAAAGPDAAVPPGMAALPRPGEYLASPALVRLLEHTPPAQLADRFPGHLAGTLGRAALPAPTSLVVVVGRTPTAVRSLPSALRVGAIARTAPADCSGCGIGVGINERGMDLLLGVVSGALLFPVLVFVGSATRLSAARREQRLAAMRLIGATPRQTTVVAATESMLAAAAGTVLGFGMFFLLRPYVARIPFTGVPFFTDDLALHPLLVVLVVLGVPVVAGLAARLALRRVRVSPLGVTRRTTPPPPRARRLWLLVAGLAELGIVLAVGRPAGSTQQTLVYLAGLVAVMAGLVLAGPWLTLIGSRLIVRRANSVPVLIAGRRLADDPRGNYRAISGLVLGLFVGTVAVGIITTFVANRGGGSSGGSAGALVKEYIGGPEGDLSSVVSIPADLQARLVAITGVRGVAVVHPLDPATQFGDGVVSCVELRRVGVVGRCPAGARTARIPYGIDARTDLSTRVWPAAEVSAAALPRLPVQLLVVGTDGSDAAIESARTVLESDQAEHFAPSTLGELATRSRSLESAYERLAEIVVLASLPIAGCSLAASVVAGLADRKRPFSLLRLTGVPIATLRRVVAIETVVPLLVGAAVAVAAGFLAAALFLQSQLGYRLDLPDLAFWGVVLAGLAISLAIVASTLPLLQRITGPETARND